jgi:hypothetical protein
MNFAAMIEHLAMETGKEFREAQVFLARDFLSVSQNAISSRIDVQWPSMRSDLVCDS